MVSLLHRTFLIIRHFHRLVFAELPCCRNECHLECVLLLSETYHHVLNHGCCVRWPQEDHRIFQKPAKTPFCKRSDCFPEPDFFYQRNTICSIQQQSNFILRGSEYLKPGEIREVRINLFVSHWKCVEDTSASLAK